MILNDLLPAIDRVAANPKIHNPRSVTYLSTYPSIRALATLPSAFDLDRFHQLAAMTYGWMPRVVRIDPQHVQDALESIATASAVTPEGVRTTPVRAIANCVTSVVGASKMLHFVNDAVFPIWDSNTETFRLRLRRKPSHNHMTQVSNFFSYVDEVHAIRREPGFPEFYSRYLEAFNARLAEMHIAPYNISEVRAIEAAAFELAAEINT